MNIKFLGIDLAKRVFQLHGVNFEEKIILRKRLSRKALIEFIAKLPPCIIGMEACGTAHYWGRKFKSLGHKVKLINPAFVKPYVICCVFSYVLLNYFSLFWVLLHMQRKIT